MVGGGAGKANSPGWQSKYKKLNDQEKPLFLCVPSGVVLNGGIDSAWITSRAKPQEFAIVEAKANFNPAASLHSLLGEATDKGATSAAAQGGSGRRKKITPPAGASGSPGAAAGKPAKTMYMQMSHAWIEDRIEKDFKPYRFQILSGPNKINYSRHVFLVSPLEAAEHTQAIAKIMSEGLIGNPPAAQKYAKDHAEHKVAREFGESDLVTAEETYKTQGKYKPKPKNKPGGSK
jgi:hypothetical protein